MAVSFDVVTRRRAVEKEFAVFAGVSSEIEVLTRPDVTKTFHRAAHLGSCANHFRRFIGGARGHAACCGQPFELGFSSIDQLAGYRPVAETYNGKDDDML